MRSVNKRKRDNQMSPGRQEFEKKLISDRAISQNIVADRKKSSKKNQPILSGFQN